MVALPHRPALALVPAPEKPAQPVLPKLPDRVRRMKQGGVIKLYYCPRFERPQDDQLVGHIEPETWAVINRYNVPLGRATDQASAERALLKWLATRWRPERQTYSL